jgi:hypothetical protein
VPKKVVLIFCLNHVIQMKRLPVGMHFGLLAVEDLAQTMFLISLLKGKMWMI